MIKILGDFEKVKLELKQARKAASDEIWDLKKKYKPAKKWDSYPSNVQRRINELSYFKDLYTVSRMLPVRIENLVINYKLYAPFMKKLEGYQTNIAIFDGGLVINYWKLGTLNQGKGVLKLYDQSRYFQDFAHIPSAELVDEEE